jgi:hypothetical protein
MCILQRFGVGFYRQFLKLGEIKVFLQQGSESFPLHERKHRRRAAPDVEGPDRSGRIKRPFPAGDFFSQRVEKQFLGKFRRFYTVKGTIMALPPAKRDMHIQGKSFGEVSQSLPSSSD